MESVMESSIERELQTRRESIFAGAITQWTPHFVLHYLADDSAAVDDLLNTLEQARPRVLASLDLVDIDAVDVYVYPSLAAFHSVLPMREVPDWVVGRAWGFGEPHMVSPLNPGPAHTRESLMVVAVHELAHCATANITPLTMDFPAWLSEGAAMYLAGQFQDPRGLGYLREGRFPSLEVLSDQVAGLDKVYEVGYLIVEFVLSHYGASGLHALIAARGNTKAALGIDVGVFERDWQAFVKQKYLDC